MTPIRSRNLAQLIHDAKAARVRVIVKLVSSEGIGTIAVGVAKAGADVINIAGNSGGTGAAAVTSLKNTGRAAEIGLAEVHQALCVNGLRDKVILRCSGAHQMASDVIKSCLLGADSFEFGTDGSDDAQVRHGEKLQCQMPRWPDDQLGGF
ncbi:glutamate synthase-related protein [uncultured Cohaesibacter sp.]|uniref:glutamate synthase-related protein n=1 Tax=uncultured Cohaesibacter sp. TaxID=1002546 RepID=UPI00292E4040|nr:glutamate synthase-related protein [uncultured Cohaesibacter sp.]